LECGKLWMGSYSSETHMNTLYQKTYFEALERDEEIQATELSQLLNTMYSPSSVIDLGAGTGAYLTRFTAPYIRGIDISPEAIAFAKEKGREIKHADLRKEDFNEQKCDLALCLEVIEHIGSEYEEVLLKNICSTSDLLIVSIAGVGQAGENHVNLKPMCYWTEEFKKRGFERDYFDEVKIVAHMIHYKPTFWLIRNLMVLKRI
jgi:SAM-dependent methyltransferase